MQRRRVVLQSPRLREEKKRRRRIRLAIFFGILILISVGYYFLVRLSFLNVQSVTVSGAEVTHEDDISKIAFNTMQGYYAGIMPKTNIFFYPKKEIASQIETTFPRIGSLSMSLNGSALQISIKEKDPFALWCSDTPGDCYFLDSAGDIFAKAPDFSDGVYKIFTGAITGDPIGQMFLSETDISHIRVVWTAIQSFGVPVSKIKVVSDKETRISTPSGTDFIIDLGQDATSTAENAGSVLESDQFKNLLPDLDGVDYIDLRFGSKVYFKRKSGAGDATSTASILSGSLG